jgi:hypothetical protein
MKKKPTMLYKFLEIVSPTSQNLMDLPRDALTTLAP